MRATILVCMLALAHSAGTFAQIALFCNASSSTEATGLLINGSRVLERLNESSDDPTTTALLCQSVSYSTDVLSDMKFQGVVMAYAVVLMNYGLACTASIPTPDTLLGMGFFFGIVSMTSLQYLSTVVGLVAYSSGAASVNSLFSDCLVEGTTGFKLFNLLAILAGAWQPFVLASLSLLMLYAMVLVMCWRVWRQTRDGEDYVHANGMVWLTLFLALFHCLWPLFNLFIWVFSLSFVFSFSFLPSFLLLAGIMYVLAVLLGSVHHYWAFPILNGKWKKGETGIYPRPDPEDTMKSWVPKRAVEIVYNVTAPYHWFGTHANVFHAVSIDPEDQSGKALINPVVATLLLFSLSILVTSGTHLALHVYSGHSGGELIDELYRFQYDTSYLVLPVFNTDFAAALKALEIAAFGFDMPELDWGPENFKELSRDLQTCTVLLAFLKSAITLLGYVLAAGDLISPSVGIAVAASGKVLEMPEKKTGCLALRFRSCCCPGEEKEDEEKGGGGTAVVRRGDIEAELTSAPQGGV
jgi:hypothetical protein